MERVSFAQDPGLKDAEILTRMDCTDMLTPCSLPQLVDHHSDSDI